MVHKHFHKELDKIKQKILTLGKLVEERFNMAVNAIKAIDGDLALKIIKSDYEIDQMEVDVEEECLKVLALYQPVAVDLRFIIAVIKINNDLERIGDEIVNIAMRINSIYKIIKNKIDQTVDLSYNYTEMACKVNIMLKSSLDALVNLDVKLAFKVCLDDDAVDKIKTDVYNATKEEIKKNPDKTNYLINVLLISRHLERIGDHATNIAEEVVYLCEGAIIRHELISKNLQAQ